MPSAASRWPSDAEAAVQVDTGAGLGGADRRAATADPACGSAATGGEGARPPPPLPEWLRPDWLRKLSNETRLTVGEHHGGESSCWERPAGYVSRVSWRSLAPLWLSTQPAQRAAARAVARLACPTACATDRCVMHANAAARNSGSGDRRRLLHASTPGRRVGCWFAANMVTTIDGGSHLGAGEPRGDQQPRRQASSSISSGTQPTPLSVWTRIIAGLVIAP